MLVTFETVNNTANTRFDGRLEATVESAPQIVIDQVAYIIQKHYNQPYTPLSFRHPLFYIPSLPAAARGWLAVDATAGSGKHTQHQLLLFIQPKPGGPWKLSAAPVSAAGQPIQVALSPAGTATTAAADDPGLAIAPSQLPARHAALLNGNLLSPGFAGGRWTSALTRGIRAFKAAFDKAGWKYRDDWTVADYPSYALQTKDGGAVVWYFLKDRQTAVRMGSGRPLQPGRVVRALTGKESGGPPLRDRIGERVRRDYPAQGQRRDHDQGWQHGQRGSDHLLNRLAYAAIFPSLQCARNSRPMGRLDRRAKPRCHVVDLIPSHMTEYDSAMTGRDARGSGHAGRDTRGLVPGRSQVRRNPVSRRPKETIVS